MADVKTPSQPAEGRAITEYLDVMGMESADVLRSIYLSLKDITKPDGMLISQSSLQDLAENERRADSVLSRYTRGGNKTDAQNARDDAYSRRRGVDFSRDAKKSTGSILDDFEKGFSDAIRGNRRSFKDAIKGPIDELKKELNKSGDTIGGRFGKIAGDAFKQSGLGKRLTKEYNSIGKFLTDTASDAVKGFGKILTRPGGLKGLKVEDLISKGLNSIGDNAKNSFGDIGGKFKQVADAAKGLGNANGSGKGGLLNLFGKLKDAFIGNSGVVNAATTAAESITTAGTVAAETGTELAGVGLAASEATAGFPILSIAILGLTLLIDKLSEAFAPAIEGFKSLDGAMQAAGNRVTDQNKKNLEYWKTRVRADHDALVNLAYSVIEDSSKAVVDTWNSVLTTVTATQGYDKSTMQDLWGAYAQRLKDEGLSNVISSADIMSNLESVLKQGLSGRVAEEFAYWATQLNAAVPTQDFFQYAESYASLAANAYQKYINEGASATNAMNQSLTDATIQLTEFANNLLYASREVSGGFSTSLSNGAELFNQYAKIVTTGSAHGQTGSRTELSGVLTSISAAVGMVAPDLADSLVSAVVDAATGGNADAITALRSLSGVGASNTAFLTALLENPKKVFSEMFANLGTLQNMSSSNYMEVAEGLASVFGISQDTFARVDFGYLSNVISSIDTSSKSLAANLDLLQKGETTANDAQLRMAQVNQYMIDEGLAYVLDSEMGRAIQENMWAEQRAREIEENTYGVELQGGALDFLNGIHETVMNILNFLNPFYWIEKLANVIGTAVENEAISQDVTNIITSQRVGLGGTESAIREYMTLRPTGPEVTSYLLDTDYHNMVTGTPGNLSAVRNGIHLGGMFTGQGGAFALSGLMEAGTTAILADAIGKITGTLEKQQEKTGYTFSTIVGKSQSIQNKQYKAAQMMQAAAKTMGNAAEDYKYTTEVVQKDVNSKAIAKEISTLEVEKLHKLLPGDDFNLTESKRLEAINSAIGAAGDTLSAQLAQELSGVGTITGNSASLNSVLLNKNFREDSISASYVEQAQSAIQEAYSKLSKKDKKYIKGYQAYIDLQDELAKFEKAKEEAEFAGGQLRYDEDYYADKYKQLAEYKKTYGLAERTINSEGFTALYDISKAKPYQIGTSADDLVKFKNASNQWWIAYTQGKVQIEASTGEIYKSAEKAEEAADALVNLTTYGVNSESAKTVAASMTKEALVEAGYIAKDASKDLVNAAREAIAESVTQQGYMTHTQILASLKEKNTGASASITDMSFEDWVTENYLKGSSISSVEELADVLVDYGTDITALESQFTQLQAKEASRQNRAKDIHETQFWEDMQRFATELFPEYLNEWKKYYVLHEAYTEETKQAYEEAMQTSIEERGKEENAILKLANAMTSNDMWSNFIKEVADPTVQTNMLLSQILLYVQAIMQQNNETAVVSVPTALSSLGLGISNTVGGVSGSGSLNTI